MLFSFGFRWRQVALLYISKVDYQLFAYHIL